VSERKGRRNNNNGHWKQDKSPNQVEHRKVTYQRHGVIFGVLNHIVNITLEVVVQNIE